MSKKNLWVVALAIIVAGGWYYGFGPGKGKLLNKPAAPEAPAPTTSGEALKIGAILPTPFARAVELAVGELNARNGIVGRPVRVVFEDALCDGVAAAAAAKKLIETDGVKYLIGGGCGGEAPSIAPVAEAAKVVFISPAETSPALTRAGAYVFRLAVSETLTATASAAYALERGVATSTFSIEPYFNETAERAAPFFAAYRAKYGSAPLAPFATANAYTAVYLIKDLIEQSGEDTVKAAASLKTLKDWAGGAHGSLTLDANGDPVWKEFNIKKTENGTTVVTEIYKLK